MRYLFNRYALIALFSLVLVHCKKDDGQHITVQTGKAFGITSTTAFVEGKIIETGSGVISYGHCWSQSPEPTTDLPTKSEHGSSKTAVSYTTEIDSLSPGKKYFIRAYAIDRQFEVAYGDHTEIITLSLLEPVVETLPASSLDASSATVGGKITDDGGSQILALGVCWNLTGDPKINDARYDVDPGMGEFTCTLDSLLCETTYFVRAFATNSVGTSYGIQISFSTTECPLLPPSVTTSPVSALTTTTARSGGDVTDDGSSPVTSRGICWSTSNNPTISDAHTDNGSGSGAFTSNLTDLTPNTIYYLRAYATSLDGTGYGEEISFATLDVGQVITDYDGNVYYSVEIGDQSWMTQNLRVTHYADGTPIPHIELNSEWDSLGISDKAWCWYQNLATYKETHGALYTWAAATNNQDSEDNPSGIQGVCPDGWHLPSDAEWKQLEMHLGMSQLEADKYALWRGTDEGGRLKEPGTDIWGTPNTGGTNTSGFSAVPGGHRRADGSFNNLGYSVEYWTATKMPFSEFVLFRSLFYDKATVYRDSQMEDSGISVRCVKD